jgi:hypothetical protein
MCDVVLFLLKAPLLWIGALLMHGPCIFTCSTLLMGPPIGLWTLTIDGWLLFFAASLSNCNCIVIAFVSFGYNWRFVCLGWFSLVLGGRLFPQAILFCFPFAWIFMFICTAGFQLVSQACLATFWSIQYLHLIKKKKEQERALSRERRSLSWRLSPICGVLHLLRRFEILPSLFISGPHGH